jgi:diguanylate cyclase (GGDEF)-like protein
MYLPASRPFVSLIPVETAGDRACARSRPLVEASTRMPTLRHAVALFLPGGLVVAAALVVLRPGVVPGVVEVYVHIWAVLVLLVGVFLAWYYNRGRIVFALLLLTGVDVALRWLGPGETFRGDAGRVVVAAVAVLLPLNLAAYAVLAERGPLTGGSLRRLIPILAQVVGVGLMARGYWPAVTTWLDLRVVGVGWTDWTAIPQTGVLAFVAAALYLVARCARYQDPTEAGFLWALVAAFVALHGISRGWSPTAFLAAGGWVLIGALLETGHRTRYYDALTELPGVRALNDTLSQLAGRYVLALVRVDHFKRLRASFGREVRDQVVRMVATQLRRVAGGGMSFRYGGDGFVVLFAGASAEDAVSHLDAARRAITAYCFVLRSPGRPRKKPAAPTPATGPRVVITVTVSIGAAEREDETMRPRHVIRTARGALRDATAAGGNQVTA